MKALPFIRLMASTYTLLEKVDAFGKASSGALMTDAQENARGHIIWKASEFSEIQSDMASGRDLAGAMARFLAAVEAVSLAALEIHQRFHPHSSGRRFRSPLQLALRDLYNAYNLVFEAGRNLENATEAAWPASKSFMEGLK